MGEGPFPGEPDLLPNSGLCKYLIAQLVKMSGTSLNVNLLFEKKQLPKPRQNLSFQSSDSEDIYKVQETFEASTVSFHSLFSPSASAVVYFTGVWS